ncbi:Uncharacterized damage-inducible protein DinB (forms a four-helix bundle) [Klenkia soli]|uniref:Uncharacterized damage-inducible protein DinB (Forms a four-helix bundle) n=1 Tax=Klenkia soli TaxID=1052260 RepID=A0A1H0L5Y6_9ACTN|nr:DinB family protein [Klenkia soli]SDO63637.1 Uncharacterized damage-inducible protein DinB (forms a four-helix bundle) [Klenkia soli]
MRTDQLLSAAFDNIAGVVDAAVDGLTPDQLAQAPRAGTNSIAWLVWHLTRVQDDHVADVAGHEQVYTADGWARRFDLPFPDAAHGYGMSAEDAAKVHADAELLTGYHHAVSSKTKEYLATLSDDDLERVVDERWDPPVTLGVRLVSVITDDLQHAGQAAYVRGLIT